MRNVPIVLCFALVGCASPSKQAVRVDLSDGVNKREASVIADDYLRKYMSVSLGHTGPYDGGKAWIFKIAGDVVPVGLTNIPPVLIDKRTGGVTWEAKPPLKR